MVYNVETIVTDVKVAMDSNSSDRGLIEIGDVDTLQLDELIRSRIELGVGLTHMDAPTYLLEQGHTFAEQSIEWDGRKGAIILPDDFFRLIVFKMSDWRRKVYTAISEDDPAYIKMQSQYMGVAGTPEKPVVALVNDVNGLMLEFSSCSSSNATVEQAMYVPRAKISAGGIDLSKRCYEAAVYRIASLVYASLNDERATTMADLSKAALV